MTQKDIHAQMYGRSGGTREQLAVPRAEFRSYYGRAVLKAPVWDWKIAAYLFTGGLSAGSAMLAAGADLTGRTGLRRVSRVGALASLAVSAYLLVADLGRPERFHHMLRVAKPSSPMSMGTWILSAYGPGAGLAGLAELMPKWLRRVWIGRLMSWLARPAGAVGRGGCARGGVIHGGAVVADGGSGVAGGAPVPALRVHRLGGGERRGTWECCLRRSRRPGRPGGWRSPALGWRWWRRGLLQQRLGLSAEAYTTGKAHRLRKWSEYLTVAGALGAVVSGRNRPAGGRVGFGTAGRKCAAEVRRVRGGGGVNPRPEICCGAPAGTPRCAPPEARIRVREMKDVASATPASVSWSDSTT